MSMVHSEFTYKGYLVIIERTRNEYMLYRGTIAGVEHHADIFSHRHLEEVERQIMKYIDQFLGSKDEAQG